MNLNLEFLKWDMLYIISLQHGNLCKILVKRLKMSTRHRKKDCVNPYTCGKLLDIFEKSRKFYPTMNISRLVEQARIVTTKTTWPITETKQFEFQFFFFWMKLNGGSCQNKMIFVLCSHIFVTFKFLATFSQYERKIYEFWKAPLYVLKKNQKFLIQTCIQDCVTWMFYSYLRLWYNSLNQQQPILYSP